MRFVDEDGRFKGLFRRTSFGEALWSSLWAMVAGPFIWFALMGIFKLEVIPSLFAAMVLALIGHFTTWNLLRRVLGNKK